MVRAVKFLLVSFVMINATACGKKKKPSPPAPCTSGVNKSACSLSVRGESAWTQQLTSYSQDPKTKQTIPGSEKKITVTYEFKEAAPNAVWRRTMIIESAEGNTAMFQEGPVKQVLGDRIELGMDKSSCDDSGIHFANQDVSIYYKRHANHLRIDNQPIVDRRVNGLGDIFGNIITEMVGQALRSLLESAFTFGSARQYLTSGHGSLNADSSKSVQTVEAKKAVIGCFSTFGTGFTQSAKRPEW